MYVITTTSNNNNNNANNNDFTITVTNTNNNNVGKKRSIVDSFVSDWTPVADKEKRRVSAKNLSI